MTKLFTAAEIAELKLPNLPATKRAIQLRAEKEGWQFETRLGLGGVRKVYDVPSSYFAVDEAHSVNAQPGHKIDKKPLIDAKFAGFTATPSNQGNAVVAGTVVAGSAQGDLDRIQLVVKAVTEWEAERGVKISDDRRPAVIAVLYDYLKKAEEAGEGNAGLDRFLAALG